MMIGDLARRTDTKVNTIRFYEDIGLMPKAVRTGSGRRTYAERDFERLSFIRQGRQLGFSVEEIRSLLTLTADPDQSCNEVADLARRHLASVEARIARLERLRGELKRATSTCNNGKVANCRVVEAIIDHRR